MKLSKPIKLLLYFLVGIFHGSSTFSLTCEDVRYVDEKFNYNSALYTALGCQSITPELIKIFHNSNIPVVKAEPAMDQA